MTVYARQIALATRLINAKGQYATWRQVRDAPAANPAQPWKPVGNLPSVDFKVKIVFLPNNRIGYETLIAMISKEEIKTGSVIGLMAGSVPFVPTLKDVVLRPAIGAAFTLGVGIPYRLNKLSDLNVDGASILYTLTFDV